MPFANIDDLLEAEMARRARSRAGAEDAFANSASLFGQAAGQMDAKTKADAAALRLKQRDAAEDAQTAEANDQAREGLRLKRTDQEFTQGRQRTADELAASSRLDKEGEAARVQAAGEEKARKEAAREAVRIWAERYVRGEVQEDPIEFGERARGEDLTHDVSSGEIAQAVAEAKAARDAAAGADAKNRADVEAKKAQAAADYARASRSNAGDDGQPSAKERAAEANAQIAEARAAREKKKTGDKMSPTDINNLVTKPREAIRLVKNLKGRTRDPEARFGAVTASIPGAGFVISPKAKKLQSDIDLTVRTLAKAFEGTAATTDAEIAGYKESLFKAGDNPDAFDTVVDSIVQRLESADKQRTSDLGDAGYNVPGSGAAPMTMPSAGEVAVRLEYRKLRASGMSHEQAKEALRAKSR